jgi:MoxR-like ATPase
MPVLLIGESGSGKSTLSKAIADDRGTGFAAISFTQQTSVNDILGFKSVTGDYISSEFRRAYEHGYTVLFDELDSAHSNTILALNTMDNGYIAFPDGIVHAHKNFRLIATANPHDEQSVYTGRSRLDFSTLNRFYRIQLDRDPKLEEYLTSPEVAKEVAIVRTFLKSQGSSIKATMREAIRIQKLTDLNLGDDPVLDTVFFEDITLGEQYIQERGIMQKAYDEELKKQELDKLSQHEVNTFDEFYSKIKQGK